VSAQRPRHEGGGGQVPGEETYPYHTATPSGPGSLVDAALHYAALGFEVFPVRPDKAPYASQKLATTDPEVIRGWWRRWPKALIGHRLAPEHVILDVDPRHGGDATLRALQDEIGVDAFAQTRVHTSGRGDGGCHYWFVRPPGPLSIRGLNEWARARGLGHATDNGGWSAGIDLIHRDHRYTILPPSPHPVTGRPYAWPEED
jgi:hypothetical protein